MYVRIEIRGPATAAGQSIVRSAAALGIDGLHECRIVRLYFLEQDPGPDALHRLCSLLLADPVLEQASWKCIDHASAHTEEKSVLEAVEVAYRPGVTDVAARELVSGMVEIGLLASAAAIEPSYVLGDD